MIAFAAEFSQVPAKARKRHYGPRDLTEKETNHERAKKERLHE
jgi:hypothetical protein